MKDPCQYCLNNLKDEYGMQYCARAGVLDEDEMARYLSGCTAPTTSCPVIRAAASEWVWFMPLTPTSIHIAV